ncbi:Heat shock transcription factor [Lithohypha guttulata]|uniref:Heat shock transcription factor n=1 Tax=Lithohypha guttulata TaxID=1690604 RepID=UPI002DDE59AB|nr:Heat shock transcription factor [Lithohypha guttulata]
MSRKRPAPGASPVRYPAQLHQVPNSYQSAGQPLTDDQFLNWGANGQDPSSYLNQSAFNLPTNQYPPQAAPPPPNQSNQLARRPMSQMVAHQPQQNNQYATEQQSQPTQRQQQQQEAAISWSDDINELLAKAQVAKKNSQSNRKQIPPFVMKLHSFLENPRNTDLIRWADDGKSFVVLNEDEFANKLIPELFKHNNYASFVRQLNMYGFHKKVGLSDNSMRASERKAKSPSEYWNPFFRKGYPDLLWLIQKPKNQSANSKKSRGKSEEHEEDDEYVEEANGSTQFPARPLLTEGGQPSGNALTQEQFSTVQRELLMIRRQQGQIAHMLSALKREHDALVDQASDYQNKHSRHESSINAILTFLATLYNRSLSGHEGAQDIAKIFQNAVNQDSKSGVLDVNDFVFNLPEGTSIDQAQQPYKKQRLLLTDGSEGRAQTMSPAASAASPMSRPSRKSSHMTSPKSAHVEEIFDPEIDQSTRNYSSSTGQQQQDMMSLIHNTNARNSGASTPTPDFSHVLNDLEKNGGTTPIDAAQRDNMLRMFNKQSRRPQSSGSDMRALSSPARSNTQTQFDKKIASTKYDLDHLEQLQAAQEKSVENLTNLLQPLSPTGSIPGLGDGQDIPPAPLDIDSFLSNHDYFSDYNNDVNGNLDFSNLNNAAYNGNGTTATYDFTDDDPLFASVDDTNGIDNNFLDVNQYNGTGSEGRIESLASSEAPTPKNNGSEAGDYDGHVSKRRRKS